MPLDEARPLRLAPGALQALLVFLFWCLVALCAAVADFNDQARTGPQPRFADKIVLYTFVFLPFALYSIGLALAFARYPRLLEIRRLALLYGVSLLLFLTVFGLYEAALVLALGGQPVPGLAGLLDQTTAFGRWLDGMMATIALAVQGGYSYWRRGQQQAQAARAAADANLGLRLALLQGQLEPSFLLSALDGIAELVRHAERSQATRALARLSDLLRHALRASGQDWISMAEEIAFLRGYVELQQLRFGARVQVDWSLGTVGWDGPQCPPLLLHGLLDHAIARCLETAADAGPVGVAFRRAGARVLVDVSHPQGAGPVDPGQALAQTRERLDLLYQGGATLVYAAHGGRVCGVLDLPAREAGDD